MIGAGRLVDHFVGVRIEILVSTTWTSMAIGFGCPRGWRGSTSGASIAFGDLALFRTWHDLDYGCRFSIITMSAFSALYSGLAGLWSGVYTPFFSLFLVGNVYVLERGGFVYILGEWRKANLFELTSRPRSICSLALMHSFDVVGSVHGGLCSPPWTDCVCSCWLRHRTLTPYNDFMTHHPEPHRTKGLGEALSPMAYLQD